MATKRELELELAFWQERINSTRNGLALLQSQAVQLNAQSKEAQESIARLDAELKAHTEESTSATQSTSQSPAEEKGASPA